MKANDRNEYLTRDSIMKLLSEEEIVRLSTASGAPRLSDGDEYVDLKYPNRGIRRVFGGTTPHGQVLARKTVRENTWRRIVHVLSSVSNEPIPLTRAPPSNIRSRDW